MFDPKNPPEVIIETDDDDAPAPGEWTPARGMRRGALAALLVGAVLGGLWCLLAWQRPDLVVGYKHEEFSVMAIMGAASALLAFLFMWLLFASVHHTAQMVGGLCPVIVVVTMLAMVVAKQLTVAATPGVDTLDGVWVKGAEWLAPGRFLVSNVGVWVGIVLGVVVFREGDSILDLFTNT
ncbi:MAG TPA: hypothetical protein P5572_11855 [Phycisphaerae bacterium]|nr:hypothetical protein [Phycisphaerae bacterium]